MILAENKPAPIKSHTVLLACQPVGKITEYEPGKFQIVVDPPMVECLDGFMGANGKSPVDALRNLQTDLRGRIARVTAAAEWLDDLIAKDSQLSTCQGMGGDFRSGRGKLFCFTP